MAALPEKIQTIWFVNEDENVMTQFLAGNHAKDCGYIIGENGSYEKFLMALYWDINKDIPQHYDLLFEVLSQLRSMQRQLTVLEDELRQTKNIVKHMAQSIDELQRGKQ